MERIPHAKQDLFKSDFISAWASINNGVVDQNNKTREKYWNHWKAYTNACKSNPNLVNCSNAEKIILITGFAARVRTGHYGRGRTVRVQSVTKALAAISTTIELAGESSPIYKTEKTYKLPVARLIEGYRREDPPSTPQLALPIAVPEQCLKAGRQSKNPYLSAIGELSIIAFYYLLRVGEYTKPRMAVYNGKTKRATRTIQFSVGNIGFFKDGKILPRRSKLNILLQADSCTLKITNQKNGRMGETIHQFSIDSQFCPVKALAHRVHHIIKHGGTTDNLICDVYDKKTKSWNQVTSNAMLKNIRQAVHDLKLSCTGINADLIGVHSLRAGGAMALKLQGASDTTIMKIGRWTSLTFLQYIHNQIAHLNKNISLQMSQKITFQNIAAIEKPDHKTQHNLTNKT